MVTFDQFPEQSETEWLCVDVAGYKIINVYKPLRSRFTPTAITTFPHPSLYVGDFNCDFSHSSRKAWRTTNKLTGRSGRSFCQCTISVNSIASQLVKNRAHKTRDRESTRLVNKQLSDQWKIRTPEGHSVAEPFRPDELAAALRRLKP